MDLKKNPNITQMDFWAKLRKWTLLKRNCFVRIFNSDGKVHLLTKPKRNADFRAKPKGLYIFIMSLNLMDLALEQKKEKAKQ
jgi:hypothetical protein